MNSFDQGTADNALSDDMAISRMFDLVQNGQTDNSEFALLDAVIQARLRRAYDDGLEGMQVATVQVAAQTVA